MADSPQNPFNKIRTFADDLERARSKETIPKKEKPEPDTATEPKKKTVSADERESHFAAPLTTKSTHQKRVKKKPRVPTPIVQQEVETEDETRTNKQPEKESDSSVSARSIPAFHELEKHVTNLQKEAGEDSDKEGPIKVNVGYDAEVITDTKAKRFNIFSAVGKSVKDWFKKITTRKKKKAPKYTVSAASHRKGVIQKATTKTGTSFTDNESIKEQIRRRKLEEERHKTEEAMKQETEEETIWSPYTESGYNLISEKASVPDRTQNAQVEYKRRPLATPQVASEPVRPEPQEKVPAPIKPPAKPVVPIAPPPKPPAKPEGYRPDNLSKEEDPETEVSETTLDDNRWSRQTRDDYRSTETQDEDDVSSGTETEESEEVRNVSVPREPVRPEPQEKAGGFWSRLDTNTLTLMILLTIIGVVIIVVVSRLAIQFTNTNLDPDQATQMQTPDPTIADAHTKGIVLETNNLDSLPIRIDEAVLNSPKNLTEIILLARNGEEVSPSYIFSLLEFEALATLKQSLIQVRFITVDNSDEVVLLKFVDETTVRGGLLYWEQNLLEDMSTIYNLPIGNENDFVDKSLAGFDTRVVKDDEDNTVLLYSIIDDDTALIANNETNFLKVIEMVFSE